MKLKLSIIIFILFSFNVLYAQKDSAENSLKKAKLAFLFSATTFNLQSFENATIALKWHISNKTALRLSFTKNFDHTIIDASKDKDSVSIEDYNNNNIFNLTILIYPSVS